MGELQPIVDESRALGGMPDPESLINDPVERAKFLEYKEKLASRAAPYRYSAVDAGKKPHCLLCLAFFY